MWSISWTSLSEAKILISDIKFTAVKTNWEIVKFKSHKKKTALDKKRTVLKNVRISQLFPDCPAATALASKRLFINENLTPYRRDLMKETNQMRKDGMLSRVWSMDGKIYVKKMQYRESIPRKTSTTYDIKLAWLHFRGFLSLTV